MVHTGNISKHSRDSTKYSSLALKKRYSSSLSASVDADRSDIDVNLSTAVTNTLSMISTPWSTESWCSLNSTLLVSDLLEDPSCFYYTNTMTSLDPLTTTYSSCIASRTVGTYSRTTLTLYSFATTPCISDQLYLPSVQKSSSSLETLSSWTPESVGSVQLVASGSSEMKVQYPWSPATKNSCTDYYPNSLDTCSLELELGKDNKDTLKPATSAKDLMSVSFSSKVECHEIERSVANENYFPTLCTVI
ncbi:uncharacterized protein LOC124640133 [Helicoverpa zea]|uniref:uncharacterized protein LOC124640133 n=1 Tax=Helicoverpa zea TaxID=7113 RepID=UPI001F5708A9|nr:uncharacterized protein LOC124640133 [Helicoverpa zea]